LVGLSGTYNFSTFPDVQDDADKIYQGQQIAGSVFWEIRNDTDSKTADQLLVKAFIDFLNNHGTISMREFFKHYENQFTAAALTDFRSTVDGILRAHNVPL
jgi:hypothetical protein